MNKLIYNRIFELSILCMIIFGIIIITMILTGNAHYSIPIKTLAGDSSIIQPNHFFDFSVLMIFISLLLIAVLTTLNYNNDQKEANK